MGASQVKAMGPHFATEAAPLYAKAGVVEIMPTVTAMDLTERNDSIFRISANDEQQATALGDYIKRKLTGQKISVVYSDNILWRRIAELVKRTLPSDVEFESLREVPGANDRLTAKFEREPRDVIYILLEPPVAAELIGALRARGIKSLLIGGQRLLSRSFWQPAGRTADGVEVIAPIQSVNSPEYRRVVDLLKREDVVPDLVALYSYVAVQIWAESARRAGSDDPKKVAAALQSGEFATAIGPVAFDKTGNRRNINYSILTWQDGRLTQLGTDQRPAVSAPPAIVPPVTQPHSATERSKAVLRFEQPVPFGPVPIKGKTINELADHIPLFPPVETTDEALWKRNCSACHKWDRQSLCQQGASYVANSDLMLSQPHPFGGAFKLALAQWFKAGCQ